jgi:hypothetical protein
LTGLGLSEEATQTVKEPRTEEQINARLRELAEEARNLRRDIERERFVRVPEPRGHANDRPAKGRKKR